MAKSLQGSPPVLPDVVFCTQMASGVFRTGCRRLTDLLIQEDSRRLQRLKKQLTQLILGTARSVPYRMPAVQAGRNRQFLRDRSCRA